MWESTSIIGCSCVEPHALAAVCLAAWKRIWKRSLSSCCAANTGYLRNHSGRPPPLNCFGPSPCARYRSPRSPSSFCRVHRLQPRGRQFVRTPCNTADRTPETSNSAAAASFERLEQPTNAGQGLERCFVPGVVTQIAPLKPCSERRRSGSGGRRRTAPAASVPSVTSPRLSCRPDMRR